jgi:hypothetical protein
MKTTKQRLQELAAISKPSMNESMIGRAINDLLQNMEMNIKLTADVLKIINLAKEDKEGNADIAVQLMMDRHGLDEELATEAVTRIFKKAFEWVK